MNGPELSAEEERAALGDPHFADAFLDFAVVAPLARGYLNSGCGGEWLTEVFVAMSANSVEIAQKLLCDDGEGALAAWNA